METNNKIKAFYWEGEVENKHSQTGKQLQIVVIFAHTLEYALEWFYKKERCEGNAIRERLNDLLEFTTPIELSSGMTEIALTLLYAYHISQKIECEKGVNENGVGMSIHKFYRYTPSRILYMLARTDETKKKQKAVKTIELDELE